MLSAVASLPDDEAIENMTADVVDDLLKRDVDTIHWHHYIKNYGRVKRQRNIVPSNYNTRGARGNAIATPPYLYACYTPCWSQVEW